MRMPWHRAPKVPAVLRTLGELRVRHDVTYGPKPRPVVIIPILYDPDSMRRIVLNSIDCMGQHSVSVLVPLHYFTRNPADGRNVELTLELRY